jgi:hypothetical protein|tara:strand:- start:659 stop:1165 length:507 start_codon:yes stop_codon:yes gene_type:complete
MWFQGQVELPVYNEYKNLAYEKRSAYEYDITDWKRQGYTHTSFTGAMHVVKENYIWLNKIAEKIGLSNCGFTFYKMSTGDIMPRHTDHFNTYQKIFNVEKSKVWRAVVVLQDWEPGHYFDIEHRAIVNYKRGEFVLFDAFCEHSAANLGLKDRYTLQITGQLPSLEAI